MKKSPSNLQVVIISGLSGSGKTTAMRALEDGGFYCVDNLPILLFPQFFSLCLKNKIEIKKICLVIDSREKNLLGNFKKTYDDLKKKGYLITILFLESSEEMLARRFITTRRPHPLDKNISILDAIKTEREILAEIKELADIVLDTSHFNVHSLKEEIYKIFFSEYRGDKRLSITLQSFGFNFGIPINSDMILDVRFLPNPFFVEALKELNGKNDIVASYVLDNFEGESFLHNIFNLLKFLIPMYEKEGKSYFTLSIGCTGGKHRSVAVTCRLKKMLESVGYNINLKHRDLLIKE